MRETYGLGRDRASCYAFAFGKHLVGDFVSGVIYELDEDTHKMGRDYRLRGVEPQSFISDYKRVKHKEVVLNFQTGVGLEDGNEPLVYLNV